MNDKNNDKKTENKPANPPTPSQAEGDEQTVDKALKNQTSKDQK